MLTLRKTFCELGNIPLNIYSNPYFMGRIKLMNNLYGTDKLWTDFLRAADYYKTSQDYKNHIDNLVNQMNNTIDQRLTAKLLENATKNIEVDRFKRDIDIYCKDNIGKKYIRIYIKNRYFSALSWVHPSIIDNTKAYEVFIRKYTDDKNLISNFDVQALVLGRDKNSNLRYALDALTIDMLNNAVAKCFAYRTMCKVSDGEVIIELSQHQGVISYNNLSEVLNKWGRLNRLEFEIEIFTLGYLEGIDTYVKRFETGKIGKDNLEIVNPDPATVALAIKAIDNLPVQDGDKYFTYNGHLSKFLEVPKIRLTYGTKTLDKKVNMEGLNNFK